MPIFRNTLTGYILLTYEFIVIRSVKKRPGLRRLNWEDIARHAWG